MPLYLICPDCNRTLLITRGAFVGPYCQCVQPTTVTVATDSIQLLSPAEIDSIIYRTSKRGGWQKNPGTKP